MFWFCFFSSSFFEGDRICGRGGRMQVVGCGGMQASWKAVMEVTKAAVAQNDPPLVWGTDVVTCIHEHGIGLPNVDLANVLLQCLYAGAANGPSTATVWTYIHHSMSLQMVSALHMLALLASRCVPCLGFVSTNSVYVAVLFLIARSSDGGLHFPPFSVSVLL